MAFFARDWQQAEAFAQHAIETDPGHWVGYLQLAQAKERLGDYDVALSFLSQPAALASGNSKVAALKGFIQGVTGQTDAAHETLRKLDALRSERFMPPYAEALVWLGLGDLNQVARSLERCIEVHDVHLNFLLADAKWDPIASEPWFSEVLSRCGFKVA